jgi:hypothetical protein
VDLPLQAFATLLATLRQSKSIHPVGILRWPSILQRAGLFGLLPSPGDGETIAHLLSRRFFAY